MSQRLEGLRKGLRAQVRNMVRNTRIDWLKVKPQALRVQVGIHVVVLPCFGHGCVSAVILAGPKREPHSL